MKLKNSFQKDQEGNKIIGVGIIGLGYWGPNLVRVFNQLPGSKVLMASDLKKADGTISRDYIPMSF